MTMHRQSGHGRRVAQAHYAIDGAFLHRLGPELITAFEQASMAWHELWQLKSSGNGCSEHRRGGQELTNQPAVSRHRIQELSSQIAKRECIKRGQQLSQPTECIEPDIDRALVGLRRIFQDPNARPRSEGQAAALQLVQHPSYPVALSRQLVHVFFDECHVAFTDTSYRERLRELWTLRYLECPFTCLTATLMVQLEDVLKERLSIPNAVIFRRSTARRTIRYQVIDSKNEPPSVVAARFIQQLPALKDKQRGVVYVRSYGTGKVMSEALQCPFDKAKADDKSEILQAWMQSGGWNVASGALGTGINIEGIMHVVHVDRPYGLTSFVQQSGRGGRNGEVSESIIVVQMHRTSGWRRKEILSAYSVEAVDEEAMTAYIQARTCRRKVLSQYMDAEIGPTDCHRTDSVFCDWCKTKSRTAVAAGAELEQEGPEHKEQEQAQPEQAEQKPSGPQFISQQLRAVQGSYENMIKVMDRLQGQCIYCTLINKGGRMGESITRGLGSEGQLHAYDDCFNAEADGCGFIAYERWRDSIDFGQAKHCWECGLSQSICRRLERPAGER